MKWIKASERLPQFEEILFVKIDGIKKMGNFYNDNGSIYFHVTGTHQWEIPQERFNGILWLDEQDEGWVPVEQFADFMDTELNKGLDGKKKESLWNDMEIWGSREAFKKMLVKFKERHPPATKD